MRILFVIFTLGVLVSCGKKCKHEIVKKPINPLLDQYFGIYKQGSYWLYQNQDSTKKDSIYVTSYNRRFVIENPSCTSLEVLEFNLISSGKNLMPQDTSCFEVNDDFITFNHCRMSFSSGIDGLAFLQDTIVAAPSGKARQILLKILNDSTYTGKLIEAYYMQDTLYLLENSGIIGWKKNNETFNLIKKHLNQ